MEPAPKAVLRETGVIGLTDDGKKWIADFIKEAGDAIGVTFAAPKVRTNPVRGDEGPMVESMSFRANEDFYCCTCYDYTNPLSVPCISNGGGRLIDIERLPREEALNKLKCCIIEACPELFLDTIKASVGTK